MNIQNYINGEFVAPILGGTLDNYNPSSGEVYGQIPNSTSEDVDLAYAAAKDAFPHWSKTTLEERSRILMKISELLESNLARFAAAESKENHAKLSARRQWRHWGRRESVARANYCRRQDGRRARFQAPLD